MRQFIRHVGVSFDGRYVINPTLNALHEIRVKFSVSKTISGTANSADIRIYNLSEGARNAVGREFDNITLEAGYTPPEGGNNVGTIFKGQVRDVQHYRDGADIITEISCGDGDRALRRAVISQSFPRGTPVEDVVEEVYKQLESEGIERGEWKFPEEMPEFRRPYAACSSCSRELDRLGRGRGFYWSLQNETLEIVPGNGALDDIVLLTPDSGLIDTPVITDNGVQVSALLNPAIRPNRRVQIESQTLEMNAEGGVYRVSEATFSGDNRDGDFIVRISGEAIKGGLVDEGFR